MYSVALLDGIQRHFVAGHAELRSRSAERRDDSGLIALHTVRRQLTQNIAIDRRGAMQTVWQTDRQTDGRTDDMRSSVADNWWMYSRNHRRRHGNIIIIIIIIIRTCDNCRCWWCQCLALMGRWQALSWWQRCYTHVQSTPLCLQSLYLPSFIVLANSLTSRPDASSLQSVCPSVCLLYLISDNYSTSKKWHYFSPASARAWL